MIIQSICLIGFSASLVSCSSPAVGIHTGSPGAPILAVAVQVTPPESRRDCVLNSTIDNLRQIDATIAAINLTGRTNGTSWNFDKTILTRCAPTTEATTENLRQIEIVIPR
jgi:hypothetical protein